jgi:hypothetical protein
MTNWGGIRSLCTQKHFDRHNCLIGSDREKNSALTQAIVNQTKTGNSGFLGQKLHIHDQHILFCHSIKKRNEKMKNFRNQNKVI